MKKLLIISVCLISLCLILTLSSPLPQDATYHLFCGDHKILHVTNFWNVISNSPFLFIGILGLIRLKKQRNLSNPFEYSFLISFINFSGILLTGLGSAYYHYNPTNISLVYDRIPMTLIFMSYFTWSLGYFIARDLYKLIVVTVPVGIVSVLYWIISESYNAGDLRLYGLVQFTPIPIILYLYLKNWKLLNHKKEFIIIFVSYALAKIFEMYDCLIYTQIRIPGHPIKHLFAALSAYYIMIVLSNSILFSNNEALIHTYPSKHKRNKREPKR